jgi:lauroyl/myristoyl acyltransferase
LNIPETGRILLQTACRVANEIGDATGQKNEKRCARARVNLNFCFGGALQNIARV